MSNKILTRKSLRRLIESEINILKELSIDSKKASETSFLGNIIKSYLSSEASRELRNAIDSIEVDDERGEIVVLLSSEERGNERDVACAMRNIIDGLDLSLHWALDPCRYDDDTDKEIIMIVGI